MVPVQSRPVRREPDGEPTPKEKARRFWDAERAEGRTPTGAELDRVAGTRDYGRQLRRAWLAEEPIEPAESTQPAVDDAGQDTQDGGHGVSPAQTQTAAGGAQ